jgi:hypothetical protein
VISNFGVRAEEDGVWVIEGYVSYELDTKLRVEFGGLLANHNLDVDLQASPDGYFSYGIYLPPNVGGGVTAQILDSDGGPSNVVADMVI